ncbi:DUF6728 family protein [Luteibaculum oceani]|uniref:DUF6728 family protein n=1 Tax=Luteibaculum oceani TaxID=1294296 RepID=UPI0037441839
MKPFFQYLINLFNPKAKKDKSTLEIKAMHGINKISIVIFTVGLLYLIFKVWI